MDVVYAPRADGSIVYTGNSPIVYKPLRKWIAFIHPLAFRFSKVEAPILNGLKVFFPQINISNKRIPAPQGQERGTGKNATKNWLNPSFDALSEHR